MPRRKWTDFEFQRRMTSLQGDGFTPEEAFDMSSWNVPLSHFVIRNMRRDRRILRRSLVTRGQSDADIMDFLVERYIDLGVRGKYENEDWYFARVST